MLGLSRRTCAPVSEATLLRYPLSVPPIQCTPGESCPYPPIRVSGDVYMFHPRLRRRLLRECDRSLVVAMKGGDGLSQRL
jgi:hypothetical protein